MTIGEAVLVWRFGVVGDGKCSCGRSFSTCVFWQQVADSAPGLFDAKSVRRYVDFLNSSILQTRRLPSLWTKKGRQQIVDAIPSGFLEDTARLYEAARNAAGAQVVVDSSKFAAYRFLLGLVPDLDVTVVHLIRDPRAVAFSWQRRSEPSQLEQSDESLHFPGRSALVAGLDWVLQNSSTDVINRLDDYAHYRLRYEDFVARPQFTVRQLVEAMDVANDAIGEKEPTIELPEVHIFGNPSRFKSGAIPIRLDDEWRRQMKPSERTLITALSGPLMLRYGYSLRVR